MKLLVKTFFLLCCILVLFLFVRKTDKCDVHALKEFDNNIKSFKHIEQLTSFKLNDYYPISKLPDSLPNIVLQKLEDFEISVEHLMFLVTTLNEIGASSYLRTSEYSIYVTGGTFAMYEGFLISSSKEIQKGDRYITDRNAWNVGNETIEGVYYIYSD